jgi:hypothetical protein
VTSALTTPLASATLARKARIMPGSANRRRLLATKPMKLAASPVMPALVVSAVMAETWSCAEKAGLSIRRLRSSLSAIIAAKPSRSLATASTVLASLASSNRAVA